MPEVRRDTPGQVAIGANHAIIGTRHHQDDFGMIHAIALPSRLRPDKAYR
jgi:hypothetical protein